MRIMILAATFILFSQSSVFAQSINHAVKSVDFFEDVRVKIVDYFEDEKWQVLGTCANMPDLKVKFVDFFEDKKVKIVDSLADKKVCITNARELNAGLIRKLKLR